MKITINGSQIFLNLYKSIVELVSNRALTEFIRSGHLPEVGAPQLNNKISQALDPAHQYVNSSTNILSIPVYEPIIMI